METDSAAPLPDLRGADYATLLLVHGDDDTVLVNGLKRVLEELDSGEDVLSAFDNYAGDDPSPVL